MSYDTVFSYIKSKTHNVNYGVDFMQLFKILFFIFYALYLILLLFFCKKTGRFYFALILNSLLGVVFLTIINLTAKFSGFYIPVNEYSLLASATIGIPGTAALLIINLIFL